MSLCLKYYVKSKIQYDLYSKTGSQMTKGLEPQSKIRNIKQQELRSGSEA